MSPNTDLLRRILALLAEAAVIPDAAAALAASRQKVASALRAAVLAEAPAFSASQNPDVLPGLNQHSGEHIGEILRLFGGGGVGAFDFVKTHAYRRAEQRFPLEAILHAYRCGHKVFARWLREAALEIHPANIEQAVSAIADFAIEYTNIASAIIAAEYVAHTRVIAEAEGDRRTELLSILLSGYDESDGRVAQILKRAGYLEQRQSYCVAVAQSTHPSEMENPARAQRIVSAISDAAAATSIRTLGGIRNNLVTFVLSDRRRQSGWTVSQSDFAERVRQVLLVLGPAVLVGVSGDHPSTSFLPKALHEANIALDFASVTRRVVQFSELPIRALLVQRGADQVRSAPPNWVAAFVSENARGAGTLVQTLRAVADADMNVQKAGRNLGKHPNTIYARLERIKDATGLDGQHYRDLTELLLAADCWRI